MSFLVPHLLFRTETFNSPHAVALLESGYLISKAGEDTIGVLSAGFEHIDAVVIDLPPVQAISFAQRLLSSGSTVSAILVITGSPSAVRRVCPEVTILDTRDRERDIVSVVDLLIARHRGSTSSMASG
jgi:hypothetical protein